MELLEKSETKKDFLNSKPIAESIANDISNAEKFADLIASSSQSYLELQTNYESVFRKSFSSNIPQELVERALQSFRDNYFRKLKFRGEELHCHTYSIDAADKLILDRNILYNFSFMPPDEARRILIDSGFLVHHSSVILSWGSHVDLRNDIFERFIVNDIKTPKNYYLHGGMGVGKTTLLTGIARMLLITLKTTPRYITMPSLTRLITSIAAIDKTELERLKSTYFLFVDDIGQEKYTTDNQESLMRDFFVYRYGNLLPTFFAGNIDIRSKEKQGIFYTQLSDYIKETTLFEVIKLKGESRRK